MRFEHRRRAAALFLVSALAGPLALSMPMLTAAAGGPDPVGHWTLDEGAGATAADSSGNANDGTITGATWTTSHDGSGGALAFNGADSVAVADDDSLEPSSVTIAGWFRASTTTSSYLDRALVVKGAHGCNGPSFGLYQRWGGLVLKIGTSSSTVLQRTNQGISGDGETIWDGEWHHLAGTYDAATGALRVYIDGLDTSPGWPIPTTPAAVAYGSSGPDTLALGNDVADCGLGGFVGDMDDVRIYDHPITQAELDALMTPQIATTTTITPTKQPAWVGQYAKIVYHVSPIPPGGYITMRREGNGLAPLVYTARLWPNGDYELDSATWPLGTYQLSAEFHGGGLWLPSQVAAVPYVITKMPNPTTLVATPSTFAIGGSVTLKAGAATCDDNTFRFYEIVNGVSNLLSSPNCGYSTSEAGAQITVKPTSVGTKKFYVIAAGTDHVQAGTSPVVSVTVTRVASNLSFHGPTESVQEHHPAVFWASVAMPFLLGVPATGTVTYSETVNGVKKVLAYRSPGQTFSPTSLSIGMHSITATYSGDAFYTPAAKTRSVTIIPDTVDVTGLALTTPGFYPIVDGYIDTVGIKGTLSETASVTITIKNGSGTTVRTLSLGQRNGVYQTSWNGLNASGVLVPAGTYTVTQSLKDLYGSTVVWNGTVSLSHKKLVWTTTSKTFLANQYVAKGTSGVGTAVTTTKYSGGMRIESGVGGYAALGYQFTLPSATSYKNISLAVIGSGAAADFGAHDFRLGTWSAGGAWIIDYFSPLKATSTSYVWTSLGVDPVSHRSGQTVHAMVLAGPAAYYLHKVKLTYSYAVLK